MIHIQQDSGLGSDTGENKFKINYPELYELSDKLKNEYQGSSPFPNIAIATVSDALACFKLSPWIKILITGSKP